MAKDFSKELIKKTLVGAFISATAFGGVYGADSLAKHAATATLSDAGYTDIKLNRKGPEDCNLYNWPFTAKNAQNEQVDGVVCRDFFAKPDIKKFNH